MKRKEEAKKEIKLYNWKRTWLLSHSARETTPTHPRTHIHRKTSVVKKRIPVCIYWVGKQMPQLQYVILVTWRSFCARHSCRFVTSTRCNKLDRSTWAFQMIRYRNRRERMYRKHNTIINTMKTTGTLPNHRKHDPFLASLGSYFRVSPTPSFFLFSLKDSQL